MLSESTCDQFGVGPVIVITETSVDAVAGLELAEGGSYRLDIFGFVRHVVAGQCHNIRPQTVSYLDRPLDMLEISERAVMYIRQMDHL